MNSKERVLAAMSLEEPDRIPVDSTFTEEISNRLMKRLGLESDADLRVKLGLDVMYCSVNDGFLTPAQPLQDGSYLTELGVRVRNMKAGGVRFIQHPVKSYEDLGKVNFPNPGEEHRYRGIPLTINALGNEYAVVCDAGWGLFEKSWALRGFASFLMDMYRTPMSAERLLDLVLDFHLEVVKRICEYSVDAILFGDDFGMQDRLIVSDDLWRKMLKPRWAKLIAIPRHRAIPVMFHSDGNILEIIPDLIDVGVDVLDPVQPKALSPLLVKEKFGGKMALHGLIDIQEVLPLYSSVEVGEAIKKLINDVAPGGGTIFSPTHTVLPDVPLSNYLSFLKAVKKWGRYRP